MIFISISEILFSPGWVSNLVWVSCSGCERTERPWLHHGIYQTGLFVMQLASGSARYGVNTELRLCLLLRQPLPLPLLRLSKIFRSGSEREKCPRVVPGDDAQCWKHNPTKYFSYKINHFLRTNVLTFFNCEIIILHKVGKKK